MSTNFPSSLDSFTDKVDGTDYPQAAHINNLQDAIEALEAKVGVDSSAVSTSLDYKLTNTTSGHDHDGSDSKKVIATNLNVTGLTASQLLQVNSGGTAVESSGKTVPSGTIVGTTDSQTLTNKTLTTPTLTLKQSTSAAPTAEGDIQWDTDDNKLKVGDGSSTKTFSDDSVSSGIHGVTGSIVGTTDSQTLTNKTLTTPTLSKPTVNASVPGVQFYTPTASGTATLDCSLANRHSITMPAGNITIALSNVTTGQAILVEITQDSVGSRTVTWFSTIRWAGGSAPTLTTTAGKRDTFAFICTGSGTYDGYVVGFNI